MLKIRIGVLAVALVFGLAMHASADELTIDLNVEFSGATDPAGDPPWLTAHFEDVGADTVRLTMTATNLTDAEFVSGWYFNSIIDTALLSFTHVEGTAPLPNSIAVGDNSFQADGDGRFDILFNFPPPPGTETFGAGEYIVYDITATGLTVQNFNDSSFPGGGNGTFLSAAHVQGIGPSGQFSGWVGGTNGTPGEELPVPSSLLLLGTGLLGMGYWSRKKANTKS